jgi:hypothetical protein
MLMSSFTDGIFCSGARERRSEGGERGKELERGGREGNKYTRYFLQLELKK